MTMYIARAAIFITLGLACAPGVANAHGVAGKRFFPATMAIEDPLPADELGFVYARTSSDDGSEQEMEGEFAKRLTEKLALSIGRAWVRGKEAGETASGFGNLETGLKYQLYKNPDREIGGLDRRRCRMGRHGR